MRGVVENPRSVLWRGPKKNAGITRDWFRSIKDLTDIFGRASADWGPAGTWEKKWNERLETEGQWIIKEGKVCDGGRELAVGTEG